nr:unnamed protein product [Digitaria exilis]
MGPTRHLLPLSFLPRFFSNLRRSAPSFGAGRIHSLLPPHTRRHRACRVALSSSLLPCLPLPAAHPCSSLCFFKQTHALLCVALPPIAQWREDGGDQTTEVVCI